MEDLFDDTGAVSMDWDAETGERAAEICYLLAAAGGGSWILLIVLMLNRLPRELVVVAGIGATFPVLGILLATGMYYNENQIVTEMHRRPLLVNIAALGIGVLCFAFAMIAVMYVRA